MKENGKFVAVALVIIQRRNAFYDRYYRFAKYMTKYEQYDIS